MTGPKWHQPERPTLPDVAVHELLALIAVWVLPVPTVGLLAVGLWSHSATCAQLAALLALLGIALLVGATKLRARARAAEPPPPPRPPSTSPEQRRGSWPWA